MFNAPFPPNQHLIVNIDEEENVCYEKKKGWAIKSVYKFLEMIDARG